MDCRRDAISERERALTADSWAHVVEGRTGRFLQAEALTTHTPQGNGISEITMRKLATFTRYEQT